jgi:hypothetical protein
MPEGGDEHHWAWSWNTRCVGAGVVMVAVGWLALFLSFREGRSDRDATALVRWRVAGAVFFGAGTVLCVLAT